MMIRQTALTAGLFVAMGCGGVSRYPITAGVGADPVLPNPEKSLIPLVNVVKASSWKGNAAPTVGAGDLTVHAFARCLDHPRWLYVLPNGDVLAAETNAPKRPEDGRGIKGFFFKVFQERAGGGVPSANRITLLRDTDGDGVADVRSVFIAKLNAPFGMALVSNDFYVANSDAVVRFAYTPGATTLARRGTRLTALPGGDLNHHWTKSLIASRDGTRLYAGIGSNSNVAENGIDKERDRAMIWEIDRATGAHRVLAFGLRNPVGMAWEPTTGELWVAVNERDELGSDLVPDYMTAVRDGGFYGWPYSYFGNHVDKRVK
jgi:glucose/arabinose dehydrogenase